MGSTRLPGKVLMRLNDTPVIGFLLERLKKIEKFSKIIVATGESESNLPLLSYLDSINQEYYIGSENDVLSRFYDCASSFQADVVIRLTADCPMHDAEIIIKMLECFVSEKHDYLSNTLEPKFPDGYDVEIFSFEQLENAHKKATGKYDREHVTPYIKRNAKKIHNYSYKKDYSFLRLTLDEQIDYEVLSWLCKELDKPFEASLESVLALYNKNKEIFKKNLNIKRNEGSDMSQGKKIWKRAKALIPDGALMLSKHPDMFSPNYWPQYFESASGISIVDTDNVKFDDFCYMGVGTNILGYANSEVNLEVLSAVKKGNISSLNCVEEVELAQNLISLHNWSGKVLFARTGGEAASIAVRIARAASGKDKVALCGYHGWHDWYMATNLSEDNSLEKHLLEGLPVKGVPKNLTGSVVSFPYNNISKLKEIISQGDLGVIIMEVERNIKPVDNFLAEVRYLATKNNITLIFDECTSGFRETNSGLHKKYQVNPDIAIYGKSLGNGYPITAVVGTNELMEFSRQSFISSTFWTERLGPTAALKTLEIMNRDRTWEYISNLGGYIKENWRKIAENNKVSIDIFGIDAMPCFQFNSAQHNAYKTFLTENFLKKNMLASTSIYLCVDHNKQNLEKYFDVLNDTFQTIRKFEEESLSVFDFVDTEARSGFKRLN